MKGPPFDPTRAGLGRHLVFLSEAEAIFLFEGAAVAETVRRLAAEPGVWRAALGWRSCLAGRPRIAELTYSWPAAGR